MNEANSLICVEEKFKRNERKENEHLQTNFVNFQFRTLQIEVLRKNYLAWFNVSGGTAKTNIDKIESRKT